MKMKVSKIARRTKKQVMREIMDKYPLVPRKRVLELSMRDSGMTKNLAMWYYAQIRSIKN
jgi:hypothetical protein